MLNLSQQLHWLSFVTNWNVRLFVYFQHWTCCSQSSAAVWSYSICKADWHRGCRVPSLYKLPVSDLQCMWRWYRLWQWGLYGNWFWGVPNWQQCGIWLVCSRLYQRTQKGRYTVVVVLIFSWHVNHLRKQVNLIIWEPLLPCFLVTNFLYFLVEEKDHNVEL